MHKSMHHWIMHIRAAQSQKDSRQSELLENRFELLSVFVKVLVRSGRFVELRLDSLPELRRTLVNLAQKILGVALQIMSIAESSGVVV